MTKHPHEGGSYTRHADGSFTRNAEPEAAAEEFRAYFTYVAQAFGYAQLLWAPAGQDIGQRNIRYAAPNAPEADMLRLARRIGDGEWLQTLQDGLDTQVGERGNRDQMGIPCLGQSLKHGGHPHSHACPEMDDRLHIQAALQSAKCVLLRRGKRNVACDTAAVERWS